MSENIDSKEVAVSVKIYERLLATYPKDFRREYGPAMKQLFLDQCRDAWNQAQGRGLALLWLGVLLDWAKTSLVEHLLSLHRRESFVMNIVRAFRAEPRLRTAFVRMFAAVFAIAFVWGAIIAYLSPRVYFSTATIEVQQNPARVAEGSNPYFIVTQIKIIESYRVLTNAIAKMNLDEKLARKNGAAICWTMENTFQYLRNAISVKQYGSANLIDISVRNPDANLAAVIANATAESYRQFRSDQWNISYNRGIEALRAEILRRSFKERRELERLELRERLEARSDPNEVTVANPARPNMNSIFPTKWKIFLMWILGGTLLALLAGGVGALDALLARHSSAR